MSKFSSLILLVNSLSKAERKKIASTLSVKDNEADYVVLYKLIDKNPFEKQQNIKELFFKKRPTAAFNTAVNYLSDMLLTVLSQLRTDQDSYFSLFSMLMNAKVLYEKSIYHECFQLLTKIQNEAVKYENFSLLLIAQKMELDYLLILDFPEISEQELLSKQFKINDTLKKIRKINEHASLYELLRHRILHKGTARSNKQKQELNDLVVSEMSIVSSSGFENFEIQKNHKLFQSNYLINVGDYKSALNSFYELNNTFEKNKHLLSDPPIYYLSTIEGVLESLRTIKDYEGMSYFIIQLNNIETSSLHFKIQVRSVVFLYTLFPLIDTGKFAQAKIIIDSYKEELYDKMNLLIAARQVQLSLYAAIVYLGTKEFTKARKSISQIFAGEKNLFSMPLFRTVRLINLMILYELNEFDYIDFEVRSVKREIQNKERTYQIELMMLKLINKPIENMSKKDRDLLWGKIEPKLIEFHNNKFELQLLRIFDFTAWIEAKIKNISLSAVLEQKTQR
ncbi:MAG: hypothetical protein LLF95_10430 [Bacteroidales bacterium]|nr:hypothetical protein [Bacteroidales bacterium]